MCKRRLTRAIAVQAYPEVVFYHGKACFYNKPDAHGLQVAHLIKTAIAYLQMPCNILPVLLNQQGYKFGQTVKSQKSS